MKNGELGMWGDIVVRYYSEILTSMVSRELTISPQVSGIINILVSGGAAISMRNCIFCPLAALSDVMS